MKKLLLSLSLLTCFAFSRAQVSSDTVPTPGYDLEELVVEGERPIIQTDGAKLTYNVDEDPASESSTVLDILRKVPQVSVDGNGNIRLNGSDAFKFQLNGVDNPMLKQYAGQVLPSMPASMVVKIEVITEPGAKEDAEGTAGIINIITERTQAEDGARGSVTLQVANRNLTPSIFGIIKKDKVTLSLNANYQWGFAPQHAELESDILYREAAGGGSLNSVVGQKMKHQFGGGNLNFSWEPNAKNLFTVGADFMVFDARLNSIYGSTAMYDPAGAMLWSFNQQGHGNMRIFNLSANASYRHNFAEKGNFLVVSYLFNFGRNNLGVNREYLDFINYINPMPYESQGNKTFNRGHTVQLDYSNDFKSEKHLLEVGAKGIFRRNSARARQLLSENPIEGGITLPPSEDILQPQDILAGYAVYTGSYGKLGVIGGLRYEHTRMGITDLLLVDRSFIRNLNDWVPNAALTWNFNDYSNMRLAYQMRISRPSIEQVNPFELQFSPYEIRKGNPELKSEHTHLVSLKYSAFAGVVGGSIGLEYNLADNAISSFTYLLQQNGFNTLVTSYANIGRKESGAFSAMFSLGLAKGMNLGVSGRIAYNHLSAPAESLSNHGWSGNIGASWNYTVASVNKFAVYGTWNSRIIDIQGYNSAFYFYGLSASRDFLKDKSLTLGLSANNFFQKGMKFKSYSPTANTVSYNTARVFNSWNLALSISWKFGSLKGQVKETGVEIKNEDINTSTNKPQGAGF